MKIKKRLRERTCYTNKTHAKAANRMEALLCEWELLSPFVKPVLRLIFEIK